MNEAVVSFPLQSSPSRPLVKIALSHTIWVFRSGWSRYGLISMLCMQLGYWVEPQGDPELQKAICNILCIKRSIVLAYISSDYKVPMAERKP